MSVSPSSGTYNAGSKINISVKVNTEGQSINAVDGTIGFNPSNLEVISVSKNNSILNLWVQDPTYSNVAGNINFGGVVLNPGYSGSNGNIITIAFKVKGDGKADINFKAGSVLANDGYGTNVLKTMNGASFNIGAGNIQQQSPDFLKAEAPVVVSSFDIFSSTHPDQNKWYSNKNPVFEWQLPDNARSVKLVLAKNPSSPPLIVYNPPISKKELSDVADGVWHFKAQFDIGKISKPASTYKFQIDTQGPVDFTVERVDENDLTNPQPELIFESSDELSGIDHYEMKIGDDDWFNIEPNLAGKPYKLPFQSPGTREVLIKAIDKAGNSTNSNAKVVANPISVLKPIIKEVNPPKIKIGEAAVIKGSVEKVVVVVVVDVLKIENNDIFGQISGTSKDVKEKLIKKVEAPTGEDGNFEVKIDGLEVGAYILRVYGKDKRGVVSDTFTDTRLEVISKGSFTQFTKWISSISLRGFDGLINLLSKGWFLIALGAAMASFVVMIIKKVAPFIADETRKIRYIASEYRASKKLKKIDSKTKLELKILEKDIKKELELLAKIANHRSLHSNEQYLRNKLEKYHNILKKL